MVGRECHRVLLFTRFHRSYPIHMYQIHWQIRGHASDALAHRRAHRGPLAEVQIQAQNHPVRPFRPALRIEGSKSRSVPCLYLPGPVITTNYARQPPVTAVFVGNCVIRPILDQIAGESTAAPKTVIRSRRPPAWVNRSPGPEQFVALLRLITAIGVGGIRQKQCCMLPRSPHLLALPSL